MERFTALFCCLFSDPQAGPSWVFIQYNAFVQRGFRNRDRSRILPVSRAFHDLAWESKSVTLIGWRPG